MLKEIHYPSIKKPIQWNLVIKVGLVLFFVIMIVLWIVTVSRIRARSQSLEVLQDVQTVRNALETYRSYRNDYPPVGDRRVQKSLGIADAVCLDSSDNGFEITCVGKTFLARIPRSTSLQEYEYRKNGVAGYSIAFRLHGAVAGLVDKNKDGVLLCKATQTTITCE